MRLRLSGTCDLETLGILSAYLPAPHAATMDSGPVRPARVTADAISATGDTSGHGQPGPARSAESPTACAVVQNTNEILPHRRGK